MEPVCWGLLCCLIVDSENSTTSSSPAPGLEGVAGSLVQVTLHGDTIRCISVEIHDGVIVRHVLGWSITERYLINSWTLLHSVQFNRPLLRCVFHLFLYGSVSLLHVSFLPGRVQNKLSVLLTLYREVILKLWGWCTQHFFLNTSIASQYIRRSLRLAFWGQERISVLHKSSEETGCDSFLCSTAG